jgi:hypothetical protein
MRISEGIRDAVNREINEIISVINYNNAAVIYCGTSVCTPQHTEIMHR